MKVSGKLCVWDVTMLFFDQDSKITEGYVQSMVEEYKRIIRLVPELFLGDQP